MRYLEQSSQHLKFHIDLGNYCFKSYEQIIEDEPRKRKWIKRITAFGSLTDFDENHRPQTWTDKLEKLEDRGKLDTYITETTPHYHVDPESGVKSVGMKWIDSYEPENVWPALGDTKPRNEKPDYWLSLYELPSMLFYQLLHEDELAEHSAEKVVRIFKHKITAFLRKVKQGKYAANFTKEELKKELEEKGLNFTDIPKEVIKYLLNKNSKSFEEKAKIRLKEWKEENDRMLSRVKRQTSHFNRKPGSKDYVRMKPGNMADFLARDMIRLQQPIDGDQGKANSTEFQLLQAKLAFFGQHKNTLKETFKLCKLIDSHNAHPFLNKIELQTCKGVLDFYTDYLEQRKGHLAKCMQEKDYANYHFLKLREDNREISKLIAEQLKAVMNLPRGLFKQQILKALNSSEQTKKLAKELKNKERINVSYIIQTYFDQIRKDSSQEYYEFKRSYELLNKLYDTRKPKDKTPVKAQFFDNSELEQKAQEIKQKIEQKIEHHIHKNKVTQPKDQERVKNEYLKQYKHFIENEKQIRLYRNCDRVLFMAIDQMYRKGDFLFDPDENGKDKKELTLGEKYKLKEIKPNAEKSILSEQVLVKLKVYYPEKEKTNYKTIVHDSLKIKNYGDFRAFLKDRRVLGMLSYIKADDIPYKAIKQELTEFDRARAPIFETIHRFENIVHNKHNIHENEYGFVDHKSFLEKLNLEEEKLNQMNALRNMVCHSMYPNFNLFKDLIDGDDFTQLATYSAKHEYIREKSIAFQLMNLAINYYDDEIETILRS